MCKAANRTDERAMGPPGAGPSSTYEQEETGTQINEPRSYREVVHEAIEEGRFKVIVLSDMPDVDPGSVFDPNGRELFDLRDYGQSPI